MNGITRKDEWHYGERCESGSDMQGETGSDSARRQGEAGRQSEILSIDCIDHVRRGQALGLKFQRIDIDHDLAGLAPVRGRKGHARYRGKLLAQAVEPVVIELLLTEAVGGEAELQHRHGRGVVLHYDRRLDAGRHDSADQICR